MKRYVAFLRAVNLNGKAKVSMTELKSVFSKTGFEDVLTVLNSGNVLFSANRINIKKTKKQLEDRLQEAFGFEIPVYLMELDRLREILKHAPDWWDTDNRKYYHNLVFILSDDSAEEICREIGEPSAGKEFICPYEEVIFWSYDLSCYQKCSWWKKTAMKGIAEKLTIRTGNTMKKICGK